MLEDATRALRASGVVFAEREAEWLLEAAAGVTRAQVLLENPALEGHVAKSFSELLDRRLGGEPLQYVTGSAGFRRLELVVGPGVFIPRPETELVAERAMELLVVDGIVVDVGTGSGAIALSIADERVDATIWATEVSDEARAWAEKNRVRLDLDVNIVGGDVYEGLPEDLGGRIDVVVANPPYVPEGHREFLPVDVADHEPPGALFASDDGLQMIRVIAAGAREWLRPGGWLVFEVGHDQGTEVCELLRSLGYREVSVGRDLAGRERIAEAQM